MTAKHLAILLAILLAISIYYNIECYMDGRNVTELGVAPATFDPDSLTVIPDGTQLIMCLKNSKGKDTCATDSLGMRGGSIMIEKIYSMMPDTNINCLSYYFVFTPSNDPLKSGKLSLVFHGNRYDEASRKLTRLAGPYYASDMECPEHCPHD